MAHVRVHQYVPVYAGPADGSHVEYRGLPDPTWTYEGPPGYVFRYRVAVFSWGLCYLPDGEPFSRALVAWPQRTEEEPA